ncbi:MAG: RidA family protein [Polyangia bacterium]
MAVTLVNPPELARARGFSHAAVGRGAFVALAGQIGWDKTSSLVSTDFVVQFEQALANLCVALAAAGGAPSDIMSLRIYVVDKREYATRLTDVGIAYRKHLGKHYPAMALVEVSDLLEPGARVEIEGLAVIADEVAK